MLRVHQPEPEASFPFRPKPPNCLATPELRRTEPA